MSSRILMHVSVSGHAATGKTKHTFNAQPVSATASLRILQYEGDPGVYLMHIDAHGQEIADTYHDTVAEAQAQAQWEYDVKPDHWAAWFN